MTPKIDLIARVQKTEVSFRLSYENANDMDTAHPFGSSNTFGQDRLNSPLIRICFAVMAFSILPSPFHIHRPT
jgi:hypothetical protein